MAEVVNETLVNATESTVNNATGRIPASPEGAALAYGSLILMAVMPIFLGAFRSVKLQKEQKASGEKPDTMTTKDAAVFPIIASGALLGLYIFFQLFSKDYINLLLTSYFFFLGVVALAHIMGPTFTRWLPDIIPNQKYRLHFTQLSKNKKAEDIVDYIFDHKDLICFAFCSLVGVWYLWKKHWIANNLFGLAFAINGVELLHLNKIITGLILLGGLFIYDIFWVFGTDVMVTVAKSFEAPIKMIFPQDLLEKGFEAKNFAMLGLGDIVIPGIFLALLLRYDVSLKRKSNTYFNTGFIAYIIGLVTTIVVMHVFKHAQPALLYLVPACIGLPLFVAIIKGDIKSLFQYEDHPAEEKKTQKSPKKVK
ncbi:Minor histocompatibility antigen H13 [Chamberlinius hualienensis]